MSRPKADYRTGGKEAYKNFCNNHPSVKITYKQYQSVIHNCNEMIMDYVIDTGEKFRLPFGFGDISIDKWKPKRFKEHNGQKYINLPIDWAKTRKEGTWVYNINAHTDGFRFGWKWFKDTAKFQSSGCYTFIPMRKHSRKLGECLKKPNAIYQNIYKEWNPKNH